MFHHHDGGKLLLTSSKYAGVFSCGESREGDSRVRSLLGLLVKLRQFGVRSPELCHFPIRYLRIGKSFHELSTKPRGADHTMSTHAIRKHDARQRGYECRRWGREGYDHV